MVYAIFIKISQVFHFISCLVVIDYKKFGLFVFSLGDLPAKHSFQFSKQSVTYNENDSKDIVYFWHETLIISSWDNPPFFPFEYFFSGL